jgi:hypothetical protein
VPPAVQTAPSPVAAEAAAVVVAAYSNCLQTLQMVREV